MAFFKKHNLTRYIKGKGMEIGALHNPLRIDYKKAEVIYVDRLNREDLIRHNPTIPMEKIRPPDVIADAMDLTVFTDESLDFVIANHLLEHLPNPIKAMKEFYRVLKTGGILYLAVPDKRYTFDHERPITPLSHIVEDYEKGASLDFLEKERAHYEEWVSLVEEKRPPQLRRFSWSLKDLIAKKSAIHFHVWQPENIIEMLNYMKNNLGVYLQLEDYYYRRGDMEIIFILKKVNVPSFPDLPCPMREKYSFIRIILCKGFAFTSSILCYLVRFLRKARS